MKKLGYIITLIFTLLFLVADFDADAKKPNRKSRKAKTEEVTDTVPKKSKYMKFVEKKGLLKAEGFVTIYRDGKTLYLEIPDSLMGQKIVFSNRIEKSGNPEVGPGKELSKNPVYILDRTDSLVLLRQPATNRVVSDGDKSISAALEGRSPVVYAVPISYRSDDSLSVVIKADKLFDLSDTKVMNMKGIKYQEGVAIASANVSEEKTAFGDLVSFGRSVGLMREATITLTLGTWTGYEAEEKPEFSVDLFTSVTLLEEEPVVVREADSRIGSQKVRYSSYSADRGVVSGEWAMRWNITPEKPITIYVDTLFSPTWAEAITEGIMAWAPAFEAIGKTGALVVKPYPSDTSFNSADPLVSCVSFAGGTGSSMVASYLPDGTTGRILSCRISVQGDFALAAQKSGSMQIADVDPRYCGYYIPDDAVCEFLKAQIMNLFGRCLGVSVNAAGANAYSPEQLRDPEFTAAHGITSSVTDDVIFNYMARPGDKEKGVATIVDKIGTYDYHAIEWLYGDYDEEALDSLLTARSGKSEYLYIPLSSRHTDPRAASGLLGNDPVKAWEAGVSHLKFAIDHADEWLMDDRIPHPFTYLYIEWLWLRYSTYTLTLSRNLGGMMTNDMRSGLPKLELVPESVQRECMSRLMTAYTETDWLSSNKKLLHISGLYKDLNKFNMMNSLKMAYVFERLPFVAMAQKQAGSKYGVKECLSDIQKAVMKNVRRGEAGFDGWDFNVGYYITRLSELSPTMTQDLADARQKSSSAAAFNTDAADIKITGIPIEYLTEIEAECFESMKSARRILQAGIASARNDYEKKKLEYLLWLCEAALGMKN